MGEVRKVSAGHGHRQGPGWSHRAHRGQGHGRDQKKCACAWEMPCALGRRVIAVIDDRELKAQRDQAQATLEKGRGRRNCASGDVYPRRIVEAEAQLQAGPGAIRLRQGQRRAPSPTFRPETHRARHPGVRPARGDLVDGQHRARPQGHARPQQVTEFVQGKGQGPRRPWKKPKLRPADHRRTRITYTRIVSPIRRRGQPGERPAGRDRGGRASGGQPHHRARPDSVGNVDIRRRNRRGPG